MIRFSWQTVAKGAYSSVDLLKCVTRAKIAVVGARPLALRYSLCLSSIGAIDQDFHIPTLC
jgi:hypothetical protein